MSRVVVTVLAASGRLDLALPDEVPVERLLPEIAELFAADPESLSGLAPRGGQPLPTDRSLSDCGVPSGAILLLVERRAPNPPVRSVPARRELPATTGPAAPALPPGAMRATPTVGDGVRPRPVAPPAPSPPDRFSSAGRAAPSAGTDLVVVGGPCAGLRVPLTEGEHRVGSHRYSAVVLDDPMLSRVHLLVTVGPWGRVTVADAGSELGSQLDGLPLVGQMPVRLDQVVAAGRSLIALVPAGTLPAATSPRALTPARRAALDPPPAPGLDDWRAALAPAAGLAALAAGLFAISHLNPAWLLLLVLCPPAAAAVQLWRLWDHWSASSAFRDQLVTLDAELAAARAAEAAGLRGSTPDAVRVLDRPRAGQPARVRRPGGADWLTLRVGWGDVSSGVTVQLAPDGDPALRYEAASLLERHRVLNAVPLLVSLSEVGALGVAGEAGPVGALCRWLGVQLATLHAPGDLCLAAAVAGDREAWAWMDGLPHATRRPAPLPGGPVQAGEQAGDLLRALAGLVELRLAAGSGPARAPAVVAFVDGSASQSIEVLPRLLLQGPSAGVHLVWVGADPGRVPPECGVVLEMPAGRQPPTLHFRRRAVRYQLGGVDGISAGEAVESARALLAAMPADPSPPPRVELAELLALRDDFERGILENWIRDRSGAAPRFPRLTYGLGPGAIRVAADLRAGEHLLIGGSAGAGKSELLRSLATALAVQCSPRALGLAMVGPQLALGPCAGLPHVIRRTTDLRGDAGRELLAWLGEELARRATVLARAGAGDMGELELAHPDQTPGRLVILVDEARELLASTPDAAGALVGAAGEGGRLGVHLLLATAHVGELVAALGALPGPRVALRCADFRDSEVLIGTGEAGRSDLPPGRGFLCKGPGQVAKFQAAAASGAPLAQVVEAVERLSARLGPESNARPY